MIIQGLKKNKVEFLFFWIFSFIFYYLIFVLKGNTFIAEDDLAHTILKPQTLINCFKSNCEGINFFLKNLNDNFSITDYKLIERQVHRIASQYTFFTDLIYYLFYKISNNWNLTVTFMLVFTSIFKFIGLIGITSIFFSGKSKTIFFIFFSLVFITTPGFEPHWGQNLTAYFFMISLTLIYFKQNKQLKLLFFFLTLLSHANGVVLASVLTSANFFMKYEIEKKFFSNINYTDLIMGFSVILSYFYYHYINLDSAPPQSLYLPEGNFLITNIYSIYNYFKIIPPASAGIIFMSFIIAYLMITKFNKNINLFLLSFGLIYFLVIFTGSALMIYKKSIFLFTALFYICFFNLFFDTLKNINFRDYKNLILNKGISLEKKLNLILFPPLLLIFVTILENYIIDNPRNFFRAHISGSINNHNLEAYNKLINNLDNDKIIFSGSEASAYYAINAGLYKKKFVWSELKNNKVLPSGNYNFIFNSKVHSGGRLTSNNDVYQFYNSIILNKNNELNIDITKLKNKPDKIIIGFKNISLYKSNIVQIKTSKITKNIELVNNELILDNSFFNLGEFKILSEDNLILIKLQLDNQSNYWPHNKNLNIKIIGDIYTHDERDFFSKSNKTIKFNEFNYIYYENCKLFQIINDEYTLNFGKLKCI